MNTLDPVRLGVAGGIFWGMSLFIITLLGLSIHYALPFMELLSSIYPGYSISLVGSVIGLAYGFADGFLCLFAIGFLYNLMGPKPQGS